MTDPLQSGSQAYSSSTCDENSRCKSRSGQGMEESSDDPSTATRESQEKKGGYSRKGTKNVHFVTLMDICHLRNAGLEPQLQMYKGRVVLRGDIVNDDSAACAVFTEQGSSASQMTAAKSNGCYCKITRVRQTST